MDTTVIQAARRAQLIDDYRAAYERANGGPAPSVTYRRGWYSVSRGGAAGVLKGRASDIAAWTARLNERSPA